MTPFGFKLPIRDSNFHAGVIAARSGRSQSLLHSFAKHLACHRSRNPLHKFTTLKEKQGWNGSYSILTGRGAVFVDIDLRELDLPGELTGNLFNNGSQHFAWL